MANDYVVKPVTSKDYQVDSRVTVKEPYKPVSSNVCGTDAPGVVSGVRMNATTWPSGT